MTPPKHSHLHSKPLARVIEPVELLCPGVYRVSRYRVKGLCCITDGRTFKLIYVPKVAAALV